MSIVNVYQHPQESSGETLDLSSFAYQQNSRLKWTITVNDPANDTPERVKAQFRPWAQAGSFHPDNPLLICQDVRCNRIGPTYYEAEGDYASLPSASEGLQQLQHPDAPGWSIRFGNADSQEPVDTDYNGNVLRTYTNELIHGVTAEISDFTITFSKSRLAFNPFLLAVYKNAINTDSFIGLPPGVCRITQTGGGVSVTDNALTSEVSVTVQVRIPPPWTTNAKAWYKRIRAEGYYVKDRDGNIGRPVDEYGEPKVVPTAHRTVAGTGLAIGTALTIDEPAQFYEFPVYPERPYGPFFRAL